eukprot:IDg12716t1
MHGRSTSTPLTSITIEAYTDFGLPMLIKGSILRYTVPALKGKRRFGAMNAEMLTAQFAALEALFVQDTSFLHSGTAIDFQMVAFSQKNRIATLPYVITAANFGP